MMDEMAEAPFTEVRLEPGRYRHFKGGEYVVLSVGRHTERDEMVVVYSSVDDPKTIWVRPIEMFAGQVEQPEGTFPRFERTADHIRHPYSFYTRINRLGAGLLSAPRRLIGMVPTRLSRLGDILAADAPSLLQRARLRE
jgi:hypothetical protein